MNLVARFGLLFWMVLMTGCANLQQALDVSKPTADVSGVSIQRITATGVTLDVALEVHNPNAIALTTAGLDLDLQVEGQSLLQLDQPKQTLKLPARGKATMTVPVTLKFSSIYETVGKVRQQDDFGYRIDAGILFSLPVLGDVRVPASYEGRLPVPRLPKVAFRSVRLVDIGWRTGTIELLVNVSNPNAFGLDIEGLDYRVSAGDHDLGSGEVTATSIAGGKTVQLSLPLTLDFGKLGDTVLAMMLSRKPAEIGFSGALDYQPDLPGWQPDPVEFNLQRAISR